MADDIQPVSSGMTLGFCGFCGVLLTTFPRCGNCDNDITAPKNHIEGYFSDEDARRLWKAITGEEPGWEEPS